jgi:hypothetical protein
MPLPAPWVVKKGAKIFERFLPGVPILLSLILISGRGFRKPLNQDKEKGTNSPIKGQKNDMS